MHHCRHTYSNHFISVKGRLRQIYWFVQSYAVFQAETKTGWVFQKGLKMQVQPCNVHILCPEGIPGWAKILYQEGYLSPSSGSWHSTCVRSENVKMRCLTLLGRCAWAQRCQCDLTCEALPFPFLFIGLQDQNFLEHCQHSINTGQRSLFILFIPRPLRRSDAFSSWPWIHQVPLVW